MLDGYLSIYYVLLHENDGVSSCKLQELDENKTFQLQCGTKECSAEFNSAQRSFGVLLALARR